MILVALIFGVAASVLIGIFLKRDGYPILAMLCFMGGIIFALYMASLF